MGGRRSKRSGDDTTIQTVQVSFCGGERWVGIEINYSFPIGACVGARYSVRSRGPTAQPVYGFKWLHLSGTTAHC